MVKLIKRVAQSLDQLIGRVSSLCLSFSGALLVVMGWCTTYGAIRRYLFRSPEPYSYELASIFLLACSILALAHTQRLGRNIRVDFVVIRLPERTQAILLNIVGPILGLVFCVILAWTSWQYAWYTLQIGKTNISAWTLPLFPMAVMVPISASLLCLVLVAQIYRGLSSLKRNVAQTKK